MLAEEQVFLAQLVEQWSIEARPARLVRAHLPVVMTLILMMRGMSYSLDLTHCLNSLFNCQFRLGQILRRFWRLRLLLLRVLFLKL